MPGCQSAPLMMVAMCKLGCDDLFGRGYIFVEDGKVKATEKRQITDLVRDYISLSRRSAVQALELSEHPLL